MSNDLTKEDVQQFLANSLKPKDTFEFGCNQCGCCCRGETEIVLTGYDLFNIAKAVDIPMMETLVKYTHGIEGAGSRLPMVLLKSRLDGSCCLLRNGKCTVHADKPMVCRLYPLGRAFDGQGFYYFHQGHCKGDGSLTTLYSWLETFKIHDLDTISYLWSRLTFKAATYSVKLEGSELKAFQDSCMYAFYLAYDMEKSFEENIKKNIEYLKSKYPKFAKIYEVEG